MNPLLRRTLDDNVAKFNPFVTKGMTKDSLKTIPDYLDGIIRSSIRSLDPSIPLEYLGYEFLTPKDDFNRLYRDVSGKVNFDLAHSDVYPIKFKFMFDGVPLDRIISIPYGRDGNLMVMSGTKYLVMPVLTDTVITVEPKSIFCRLLKDKIKFLEDSNNFIVNGERTEGLLIWSELLKNHNKAGSLGKTKTSIVLYILGEYGLYKTVEMYFLKGVKKKPEGGLRLDNKFPSDFLLLGPDYEIPEVYRDDYNVYEATGIKPKDLKIAGDYNPHGIKILVHKRIEETPFIRHFIFGILETFSILPDYAREILTYINHDDPYNSLKDEIRCWRIMLGEIAYKGDYGDQKKMESVDTHFVGFKYYIDGLIKKQFKEVGKNIETFQDIIHDVLMNYVEWTKSAKYYSTDISNKYLDVRYYMCYYIMVGFNKVIHRLNRRKQKTRSNKYNAGHQKQEKQIKYNEIARIFMEHWRHSTIFNVTKSSQPNFNIVTTDYSADNMIPKCTAVVELQSCGDGIKRLKEPKFPEEARYLHGSDFVYGQILFLLKAKPSPKFRINPFCIVKPDNGRVVIPQNLQKTIAYIDSKLRGIGGKMINQEDIVILESQDQDSFE